MPTDKILQLLAVFMLVMLVTSCGTRRMARNISCGITHEVFAGALDLPFWADEFREDKHRLPHDYPELTAYVTRQSGDLVKLPEYSRVDFAMLPSGQRQAECYSISGGTTNRSVITWGQSNQ